mgnify:CR=1 FL=1
MKRKVIAILFTVLFCTQVSGSENCLGKVIIIMDYPAKCDGHVAFKVASSGSKWVCSTSIRGDALVIAAYTSGKKLMRGCHFLYQTTVHQ